MTDTFKCQLSHKWSFRQNNRAGKLIPVKHQTDHKQSHTTDLHISLCRKPNSPLHQIKCATPPWADPRLHRQVWLRSRWETLSSQATRHSLHPEPPPTPPQCPNTQVYPFPKQPPVPSYSFPLNWTTPPTHLSTVSFLYSSVLHHHCLELVTLFIRPQPFQPLWSTILPVSTLWPHPLHGTEIKRERGRVFILPEGRGGDGGWVYAVHTNSKYFWAETLSKLCERDIYLFTCCSFLCRFYSFKGKSERWVCILTGGLPPYF